MSATILTGDVLERLADIPDQSIQTVVTSPPYYGLRDYGIAGQIGLESTLADYIAAMVAVFERVAQTMRPDGTLWLNIGDSYKTDSPVRISSQEAFNRTWDPSQTASRGGRRRSAAKSGTLKNKDLMMVPARLAIALQDAGWYVRSDIIWHKPNPMPESCRDRPTTAHEHIFLLTKSARYFYDADAIREPMALSSMARLSQDVESQEGSYRANGGTKTNGTMKAVVPAGWHGDFKNRSNPCRRETAQRTDKQRGKFTPEHINPNRNDGGGSELSERGGANARNVWTIATVGFPGAHFATFPPEIPRRCILAGSREGDMILDPFAGAGTTLLVADRLNRNGIGIELNPEYADMARKRIYNDAPLLHMVAD